MLKTTLFRSITLLFLLTGCLLPSSCRRTLDYQLETIHPTQYQPPAQGTIQVDGPVELKGKLFVIDSTTTDNIISFTSKQLVLKKSASLRNARVASLLGANTIVPGDFIASDVSEKAPRGFLKKVTDKVESATEITFTVENAPYDEVFERASFAIEGGIAQTFSLDRTLSGELGVAGASITMKGALRPQGKLRIEVTVAKGSLEHAAAKAVFSRNVQIGVSGTVGLTIPPKPFELIRVSLAPIRVILWVPTPFGVPLPVPIILTPDFVGNLVLSAGIEGGFEANLVNISDSFTYGISWDKGPDGKFKTNLIKEQDPKEGETLANKPDVTLKAGGFIQTGLRPELEFSFYDWDGFTFGVGGEIFGRLDAVCSTSTKPDEKDQLEIKLSGGIKTDLFARLNMFTKDAPEIDKEKNVQGSVTFGVSYKKIKSDWCSNNTMPISNNTESAAVAVSTGDPHLSTFDRKGYSFQAVGEFVAVRSTTPGDNFEIQVRQEPQTNSTQVSLNTGLAIRTGSGSEVVCVYPDRVYLNGQNIGAVSGERALANGGKLIIEPNHLSVRTALGDQIDIRLFGSTLDYDLVLSTNRTGRIKGLFGNYDGAAANDLVRGDNGSPVQNTFIGLYPAYADSWRIRQAESLFVYETGKNTETYTDRSFPRTAVTLTAQQRASAEAVCRAAGVTDPLALSNCIVDVAMTNNSTFANRALDFQLTTSALNAFSVGEFSTSDVQLEYYGATTENRAAVLDTRSNGFSRIVMRQGVNIRRGFSTEFNFSTAELDPSSCFYLALWPTDTKTRSGSQQRVGFCFGYMNGHYTAFYQLTAGGSSSTLAESHIANFVDGRTHKVRITEYPLANGRWQVDMFLDNLVTPSYSVVNNESIADQIDVNSGVGYIEFQINQGSPSIVKLFNWQYKTL
ncbi:hypothetical protein GCM10028807_23650 [Spirosoma daeguense]